MADGGTAVHQYQNILLSGRGALNPGQLKVHGQGLIWRKAGGGKVVEVARTDIAAVSWLRIPRGYQLCLRLKAGSKVKFNGFREQDVAALTAFISSQLGFAAKSRELATTGRNWGDAQIEGNMLSFNVDGQQAFEISIADVSQTQLQGKTDVMLEFHVDDTLGASEKDTLLEMTFHVPHTSTTFVGTDEKPSSQVFQEQVLARADVGPSGDESVVEFDNVHVLIPRGRFKVQLHISHFRLQGMAVDFKIQYKSIARIFVLPKANQPHTYVVVTLDTPIRKGQTLYPHIVAQFPNEEKFEGAVALSDELLATKYKDRLQPSYKGLVHEVFAQILRGLSGSKVTRPGSFRSKSDGYAVRTSLKAEEGHLYPLEKSFFFLPKPPMLILHDEVDYVEFERRGTGSAMSSGYFDLVVRLKSDVEHQFRNIQRDEYHNLFTFFSEKHLKILNVGDTKGGANATAAAVADLDSDDDADPHMTRIRERGGANDESDEEDEDFVAGKEDSGSPSDSSSGGSDAEGSGGRKRGGGGGGGGRGSDDDDDDDDDEEEEDEEETARKKAKERKKERAVSEQQQAKASASKRKKAEAGGDEEGGKKKRKKKDPNAPKRALSGFMFFSQSAREQVKKENPGIAFTEIGKVIGEKWKNMSAEDKAPFEKKAKEDKVRYSDAMQSYKSGGGSSKAKDDDFDEDEDED